MHVVPAGVADAARWSRYGTFFSSLIGSASMSARSAITGPWRAGSPMSATSPVPLGRIDRPQPGRGQPERDPPGGPVLVVADLGMGMQIPPELDELAGVAATKASSSPSRSRLACAASPGTTKRFSVNSVTSVSTTSRSSPPLGDDGALAFVRGAAVQHLGDHAELRRAAQPVGYRLELPAQLEELVPERRG